MALITINPTSNETPDSGQGGSAVTGATNTGHSSTQALSENGGFTQKTCRWSGFAAVGGQIKAVTLKVTRSATGSISGAGASNSFKLQYSLNGGANWTDIVNVSNFVDVPNATSSVTLLATQNITQVQVRDEMIASTVDPGEIASSTATVSDIKIEVETFDANMIVIT